MQDMRAVVEAWASAFSLADVELHGLHACMQTMHACMHACMHCSSHFMFRTVSFMWMYLGNTDIVIVFLTF